MNIFNFLKEKRIAYLNAVISNQRKIYAERDIQQLKNKLWDIEEENKYEPENPTEIDLTEEVKGIEVETSKRGLVLIINDKYEYQPVKDIILPLRDNLSYYMKTNKK